jgi:hypothetical protein
MSINLSSIIQFNVYNKIISGEAIIKIYDYEDYYTLNISYENTLEIFKPITDHYNVPNSLYYEFVYKTIGYFPLTPQNFPYCKSFKTLQILVNSIKSHHKIIMSPVTSTDPSHRYTPQDISLKCQNNHTCITSPHQTDNQNIVTLNYTTPKYVNLYEGNDS